MITIALAVRRRELDAPYRPYSPATFNTKR
jgi:hypothetical protein